MLHLALLTLTLTSGGDIRLTLSQAETLASCEEAREQVTNLLTGMDIEVVAAVCGETDLVLTPFEQGREDEPYRYEVVTDGKTHFAVRALADGDTCQAKGAEVNRVQTYCARSSQSVVSD